MSTTEGTTMASYNVTVVVGAKYSEADGGYWSSRGNKGTKSAPLFTVEAPYPAAVRAMEKSIRARLSKMGISTTPGYSSYLSVMSFDTTDGRIVAVDPA
jgi:hypothetical protein